MSTVPRPLEERFFEKVAVGHDTECWEWKGCLSSTGYGSIFVSHNTNTGAHRVSWLLHYGPIPGGLCVCHRCDNRLCVNPRHLFLGTHEDNAADMLQKGRGNKPHGAKWQRRLETNPLPSASRLTVSQVVQIKSLLAQGYSQTSIAGQFQIDPSSISHIATGKSWRHI